MNSPTDEIKDRLSLVDTVQGYVRLQKAGKNWKGLCPFHTEKTPSFNVSPDKDMWYCFGCGEGGDLFTFIERIEGVEFPDALRMLADKAGVKLKREDPKVRSQRQQLYEIVELATKFFQKQLAESTVGKQALDYLKERGLKTVTTNQWRLGYAPDQWQALHTFLRGKGYSEKAIEAAGLSVKSEKKTAKNPYHDRFRHRIMFPVFDTQGNPVGFAGRVFEKVKGKTVGKDAGKYINTPNTLIYDKSGVIYGLSSAKTEIKGQDHVVVVEGNLDVILVNQAGTKNVVAASGTAITPRHLRILKRYTDKLVLAFDADDAGERATRKGAALASTIGLGVFVVALPDGKDAADVIKDDAPKWKAALDNRAPFVRFALEKAVKKYDPTTLEGKKNVSREVLSSILSVSSPLEREHWIGELSGTIGTSEAVLQQELALLKKTENVPVSSPETSNKKETRQETPRPVLEEYLLAMLANYPKGLEEIREHIDIVQSEDVRSFLQKAIEGKKDIAGLLVADQRFVQVLARAAFLDEIVDDEKDEFTLLLGMLKRRNVKDKLKNIEQDLRKAEESDDSKTVKTLLGEFNNLSKELLHYE